MAFSPAVLLALLLMQAPEPDPIAQASAAEPELRKAIEADPSDFAAHFNLALALGAQNKDDAAIAELKRTLELKPGLYEANANLGILLLRNHRAAEAVPVLKQALDVKPAEVQTKQMYGQALLESSDLAGAQETFAALLGASPQAEQAKSGLLNVAAGYEKSGKVADALRIYQQFSSDARVRARIEELTKSDHLALAGQYQQAHEPEKALAELEQALRLDPNNFELRMGAGRLLRDQRKLIPAAQQFLAATKLQPDSVAAWNELASALIVAEKYPEGLTALDRIRAMGKEVPGNFYLRAITLDKLRLKPQALEAYKQFLQADGDAHPDQDFAARQRVRIIENELKK